MVERWLGAERQVSGRVLPLPRSGTAFCRDGLGDEVASGLCDLCHALAEAAPADEKRDHGGDSYDETGCGGDERLADVAGKEFGAPHSPAGDCLEGADHATHGSQKADHGRDGGDDIQVLDPLAEAIFLLGKGIRESRFQAWAKLLSG